MTPKHSGTPVVSPNLDLSAIATNKEPDRLRNVKFPLTFAPGPRRMAAFSQSEAAKQKFVETMGIEPTTSGLQSPRSTN
jgi:hypothetical protein